jgi:hypothetical protein
MTQLNELTQAKNGSIAMPSVTRSGLKITRRLSFDDWLHIGKRLSALNTSSAWCLGDWLAYGMEEFAGRYQEAIEQTGLDYQTLRNYVWVAKQFPVSRRQEKLSFGHHAEVAALPDPERSYWLRKAEELKWSVKQLRHEVRASVKERTATKSATAAVEGEGEGEEDDYAIGTLRIEIKIRIPSDEIEICRKAAAFLGIDIEEWMIRTLTLAARKYSEVV